MAGNCQAISIAVDNHIKPHLLLFIVNTNCEDNQMTHWETKWNFHTNRFTVSWQIAPDHDLDLSWDDDRSVTDGLESGELVAFMSRVIVYLDGNEVGADYLGGSIYKNPDEFRDHIGSKGKYGSYFIDMVHEAIREARHRLSRRVYIRSNAKH